MIATLGPTASTNDGLLHNFDWSVWTTGTPQERLNLLPAAQEHILAQEEGKERWLNGVRELSQAFALSVPHAETTRIRDDVAFFQTVRAALSKQAGPDPRSEEELDLAVRQIISQAVASEGVLDIFAAAGLDKLDISVLSDEFLAEVQGDETLREIARELVETVRRNVTIDWTHRESVRAFLRSRVRRILRKYGYPPDKQEKAIRTVLEQAELLSEGWAVEGGCSISPVALIPPALHTRARWQMSEL